MNTPTPQPSSAQNGSENPPATPDLVQELRKLTEEEKRFVFRELAKDLLDPNAEEIFALRDNEGNLLGYFEPARHHFIESAKQFSGTAQSREDVLEGSVPAREFIERTLQKRNSKGDES